ncbi:MULTISPECIES: hypothetical protein [unclassified Sphingobacterium]|uniref:hypothetical protein n=1 Tax=unclassified Sphingobacterium TaxID=2609468 RepID=UPI00260051CF|nr:MULTISPECIES: hypothetical protein [unclassified Sphingobacterium]
MNKTEAPGRIGKGPNRQRARTENLPMSRTTPDQGGRILGRHKNRSRKQAVKTTERQGKSSSKNTNTVPVFS